MKRFRFSLAQLMMIVLYLGFGVAALRNADEFWAVASYNLAILMVGAAFVGAVARKGRSRVTCAGFAVFGLIYLMGPLPDWPSGGFGFGPIPRPILLIEWGITKLQPYIRPLPPGMSGGSAGNFLVPYEQVSLSLGIVLSGLIGVVVGHFVAGRDDRVNVFTRSAISADNSTRKSL